MENIVWKDIIIDNIISHYEVNNIGQVRNKTTGNILKPELDRYGYLKLNFNIGNKRFTKTIHRLVALAFIPNPENKPQVNHINGIKTDNRVENLEWVTNKENTIHAYSNGLIHIKYGDERPNTVYSNSQVHSICKLLKNNVNMYLIAKLLNVTNQLIIEIKNGRSWNWISSKYHIDNHKYYKSRKIKYKKLKKLLMGLNIFNKIDLSIILYSWGVKCKRRLLEDMEYRGYEIFIDSQLDKELKRDYRKKNADDDIG